MTADRISPKVRGVEEDPRPAARTAQQEAEWVIHDERSSGPRSDPEGLAVSRLSDVIIQDLVIEAQTRVTVWPVADTPG